MAEDPEVPDGDQTPAEAPAAQDYAKVLEQRTNRTVTMAEAAKAVDVNQAASVLRLSRKFNLPEDFAAENKEALEKAEAHGELATQQLVENHPILAKTIQKSPYAGSVVLNNLPATKALSTLYTKPPELWPLSEDEIQRQAKRVAELRAEAEWPTQKSVFNQYQFGPSSVPLAPMFRSKEELQNNLYNWELKLIRAEEGVIGGEGPIGFGDTASLKFYQNPVFWAPFSRSLGGAINGAEVKGTLERVAQGEPTELDVLRYARMRRLAGAEALRTKGWGGYLEDAALGFPAMAIEFAAGGAVGKGVTGAMGLSGRTATQMLINGAIEAGAGSLTAGLPQTGEAMASGKSAAQAFGGTFLDYLSGQMFGPWFAKATPEVQSAVKQSLALAFPKEAAKMLAMGEGSSWAKYGLGIQEERPASLRAIQGDVGALKEMGAQGLVGGLSGVAHAAWNNARLASFYSEGVARRAEIVQELAKQSPDLAKELVTDLADAGKQKDTWVPAKVFKEYYESRGQSAHEKAAEIFGDASRLDEALKSGADLKIPSPGFDYVIGREPEAVKALSKDVRPAPDVPNLRTIEMLPDIVHDEEPFYYRGLLEPKDPIYHFTDKDIEKFEHRARGLIYFANTREGAIQGGMSGMRERLTGHDDFTAAGPTEESQVQGGRVYSTDASNLKVYGKDAPEHMTPEEWDAHVDRVAQITNEDKEVEKRAKELASRYRTGRTMTTSASGVRYTEPARPLTHTEAEDQVTQKALKLLGYDATIVSDEGGDWSEGKGSIAVLAESAHKLGLPVRLNGGRGPEVTGTEVLRQGALGKEKASLGGLTKPEDMGWKEEQVAKFKKVADEANAEAANTLLEKEEFKRRARASKDFENDKAAITEAVRKEVESRPEQVAYALLAKGKKPNGEPLDANLEPFKLERDSLRKAYGEDILKQLPKGVHGEEGLSPDLAADILGFKSGKDLVDALTNLNRNPGTEREALLRRRAEVLSGRHEELLKRKATAESSSADQEKEIVSGKVPRLAAAMRAEESASTADIRAILDEIKERGGIRPSQEGTHEIPQNLKAKKGAGVPSDELAQELETRGLLEDGYSETLYKKLGEWTQALHESEQRKKGFEEEAKAIAKGRLPDTLESLIRNKEEMALLREEIAAASRQAKEAAKALSGPKEAAIEAEVERRLEAKYPQGWTPEALSEEAIAALHQDKRGELRHLELQYILDNNPSALKGMVGVASRKLPSLESIREQAKADLLKYRASELPDLARSYLEAERSGEREARKSAWKPSEWGSVFDRKLEALEAHERYKAVVDAQKEIGKSFKEAVSFTESDLANKKDTYEYGQHAKDILRRIGLIAPRPEELATMKPLAEWAKERAAWGDFNLNELTYDHRFDDPLFTLHHEDMTYGDVLALRYTMKQLKAAASDWKAFLLAGKKGDVDNLVGRLEQRIIEQGWKPQPPRARSDRGKTPLERAISWLKEKDATLVDPESFIRQVEGDHPNGPLSEIHQEYLRCAERQDQLRKKLVIPLTEYLNSLPKEIKSSFDQRLSIPGTDQVLTVGDAIMIAANGGNESGYQKTVAGEAIWAKHNRGVGLTGAQLHNAVGQLTEAQKDVAQKLIDIASSLSPEVKEQSIRLKGYPPEMIKAKQMYPEMGDRPGGYFPLIAKPGFGENSRDVGEVQVDKELGNLIDQGYRLAGTDAGYLERRTAKEYPLDYNLGRLARTLDSHVQDLAWRDWLLGMNRLIRDGRMRNVIRDYFGEEYMDVLRTWTKMAVNQASYASDGSASTWRELLTKARSAQIQATLGFRFSTLLHHALGIGTCIKEVGLSYMAKGYGEVINKWGQSRDQMLAEAPELRPLVESGGDPNLYEAFERMQGKSDNFTAFKKLAMSVVPIGNMMRTLPTYYGARAKYFEQYRSEGMEPAQAEQLAIQQASRTVRLAIGGVRNGDLPAIYNSDFMRTMLMYYTPLRVNYNQFRGSLMEARRTGDWSKFAVNCWWIFPAAAALHAMTSGKGPDEDKDESYLGWWGKETYEYAASSVPFGGMIAKAGEAAVGEKGFSHVTPSIPIVDALQKAVEAATTAHKWWEDETEWTKAYESALRASGYFTGAPTDQLATTSTYLLELMNGTEDADSLTGFAHDVLYRRTNK